MLVASGTHAFLGLVSVDANGHSEIVEELHFKRPRRGDTSRVQAVVYTETRHDALDKDVSFWPYVTGEDSYVYAQWDKALKLADMVKANPPQFENKCSFSFNCRAFAIASLATMGQDYQPVNLDEYVHLGVEARVWEAYGPAYDQAPAKTRNEYLESLAV